MICSCTDSHGNSSISCALGGCHSLPFVLAAPRGWTSHIFAMPVSCSSPPSAISFLALTHTLSEISQILTAPLVSSKRTSESPFYPWQYLQAFPECSEKLLQTPIPSLQTGSIHLKRQVRQHACIAYSSFLATEARFGIILSCKMASLFFPCNERVQYMHTVVLNYGLGSPDHPYLEQPADSSTTLHFWRISG